MLKMKRTVLQLLFLLANTGYFVSALAPASRAPASQTPTMTDSLFSGHTQFRASTTKNKSSNNNNDNNNNSGKSVLLTYLEINGWLLTMNGLTILIDPILEGNLDFGIPSLYQGKKRVLPSSGLVDALPETIDGLLITQGLDDHAHVRTLKQLYARDPQLPILAPPSARSALRQAGFDNPQIMKHGEELRLLSRDGATNDDAVVMVRATEGALVGPPWQKRENGYLLRGKPSGPSLYIEPHVEFNPRELSRWGPVDIVISPVSGQSLPAFELVHGPQDTLRLLETLQPRYLVPMQNGDIDTEGPVSRFVSEVGSFHEFQRRLSSSSKVGATELVAPVVPGEDIVLRL